MNNDNIRITYPDSEKVYMQGSLHPDMKVGMRKVSLTPTVTVKDGQKVMTENPPVYIYDTSGPYSDPSADIDLRRGLPRLREKWILQREVEQLPQVCLRSLPNTDASVWPTNRLTICASSTSVCPTEPRRARR